MEIPDCFYRVSVKALILDESRTKFLVVREDNGYWEIPGGGLDWGEDPREALKRELREEMGLETTWISPFPSHFITFVNELSHHGVLNDMKAWRANIVYETAVAKLDWKPSEECVAIKFVTPKEALEMEAFSNVKVLAREFDSTRYGR